MSSFFHKGKIFDTPAPSRTGSFSPHGHMTRVRQAGDRFFNTQIEIISTDTGVTYGVYDKDDVLYQEGVSTELESTVLGVVAFSDSDSVKSYHIKYGFNYTSSLFVLRRNTSLVFLPLTTNSNATLSEAAAAALTGISVDKGTKTVTVSTSHSINNVYDYLQWYQAQAANLDIIESQLFSTITGNNYTLKSDWKMVFTAAPTGVWNVTASNITLNAVLNLTDFNLTGTLFFDVGGTFTFTDSDIDSVDTVDGNETVVIEVAGSTSIGSNLDPGNITTDLSVIVEVTCLTAVGFNALENARVYLKAASGGPLAVDTEILNALTNVSGVASTTLNFSSNQPVVGWARKASSDPRYKSSPISGTVTNSGLSTTSLMIQD